MIRHAHAGAAALAFAASALLARPASAVDDPGAIPVPEAPRPPRDTGVKEGPTDGSNPTAPDRFALDPSRGSMGTFLQEPTRDLGVTLSFSPIHLLLPMLVVDAEVALDRKWSVDAVVGYARAKVAEPTLGLTTLHRPLFVAAAHGRYYILGNYRNGFPLVLGPKLVRVDSDQLIDLALFNATNSVGLEAMIGFKKLLAGVVAVEFLMGANYLLYRPTPAHPSAPDVGDRPRRVLLSVAFDVGVSF